MLDFFLRMLHFLTDSENTNSSFPSYLPKTECLKIHTAMLHFESSLCQFIYMSFWLVWMDKEAKRQNAGCLAI